MKYRQFDVVLVDFGDDVLGSEQGGVRPALVVQSDDGNIPSSTTIVMPFTKEIKNLYQPTHTLLKKGREKGLKFDSMLLGECMRQVSELRMVRYLGRVCDLHEKNEIYRVYNAGFWGKSSQAI